MTDTPKVVEGEAAAPASRFEIVLTQDTDGSWFAKIPALPGLLVDGMTQEHALEALGEALELYMGSMIGHGDTLSAAAPASLPQPVLREVLDAFKEYVEWFGAVHGEDCPADDTCSCIGGMLNARVNAAIRNGEAALEVSGPAAPAHPLDVLKDVLASAYPNERDHPAMFAAWRRARKAIAEWEVAALAAPAHPEWVPPYYVSGERVCEFHTGRIVPAAEVVKLLNREPAPAVSSPVSPLSDDRLRWLLSEWRIEAGVVETRPLEADIDEKSYRLGRHDRALSDADELEEALAAARRDPSVPQPETDRQDRFRDLLLRVESICGSLRREFVGPRFTDRHGDVPRLLALAEDAHDLMEAGPQEPQGWQPMAMAQIVQDWQPFVDELIARLGQLKILGAGGVLPVHEPKP